MSQPMTPSAPRWRSPLGNTTVHAGRTLLILMIAVLAAAGWLVFSKSQGPQALAEMSSLRKTQMTELTESLTRSGHISGGVEAHVILTTPEFFRLTGRTGDAKTYHADRSIVFVVNEDVHYGALEPRFSPILKVNGTNVQVPSEVRVMTDAEHHRTSAVIFDSLPASLLESPTTLDMVLPTGDGGVRETLTWITPIDYPDVIEEPQAISLGLLLSLAAGLMAAISPCLLQLTAFYIPTIAGVSAAAANEGMSRRRQRGRVLRTALAFIAGFTIPYTLGGALMGGIGQQLADSNLLDEEGPIVIGAGIVMIVMALIVARRANAPLVCKIPLPGRNLHIGSARRWGALTPFVSGFAMATGCLACFGGAILGVLLVYAGLLGSPMLGALAMFVFSIGIGVPFLLAALGISWIMPVADRMQRWTPAIGLVSAGIMLFFGIIMASGNFHILSGWLSRNLPLA